MSIPVDAGRFSTPAYPAIEPQPETSKPASHRSDERNFSVVPRGNDSALRFLADPGHVAASANKGINQDEVDQAVLACRADVPINGSQLANALRSPTLNEAERNAVIRKLAREDGVQAFYANDSSRMKDSDRAGLTEDQRIIAEGLQNAYAKGAIDKRDLLRIADMNEAPNGAQRFMSTLRLSAEAKEPGSAAAAAADALWARNGGNDKDRAAAAMYYMSDPKLMASKLDTPDKRAQAFEALANFNHSDPYKKMSPGAATTDWRNDAVSSMGRLFISHGQELIDRYTDVTPQRGAQAEVLSKFLSRTVLDPQAKGLVLDRQRDLVPTIRSVLGTATDTYLGRAERAPKGSDEQIRAMAHLGRLSAGVAGGSSLALQSYSEKVAENAAAAKEVADLAGSLVGAMTAKRLDTPFGNPAEASASAIATQVAKAIQQQPQRPDAKFASALYDRLSSRIRGLEYELHNPELSNLFDAARGAEGHEVKENLNVNPGGHAS